MVTITAGVFLIIRLREQCIKQKRTTMYGLHKFVSSCFLIERRKEKKTICTKNACFYEALLKTFIIHFYRYDEINDSIGFTTAQRNKTSLSGYEFL